jgi:hypothetical protein
VSLWYLRIRLSKWLVQNLYVCKTWVAWCLRTKNLYSFVIPPIQTTCSNHPSLFDLITLTIMSNYKFWNRTISLPRYVISFRMFWLTNVRSCIQKIPDWVITNCTLTTINTLWGATQMVMAAKLTRMIHKIAIQLHLVAGSCIICSSRSRRPVRKLFDTPSYLAFLLFHKTIPDRYNIDFCVYMACYRENARWNFEAF